MSEEKKEMNELKEENLEKVNGGIKLGDWVKHDTTYWVCPHCGDEISASYTFIARHLFRNHNEFYNFKNEDEAYEFAKTIDWWY